VYTKKKEGRLEIRTQKGERKNWKKKKVGRKRAGAWTRRRGKKEEREKERKNEGNGGLGTYI